jgi:hypothetical protein
MGRPRKFQSESANSVYSSDDRPPPPLFGQPPSPGRPGDGGTVDLAGDLAGDPTVNMTGDPTVELLPDDAVPQLRDGPYSMSTAHYARGETWSHPYFPGLSFGRRANLERIDDLRETNRVDRIIVQAADADTPTIIWNEIEDPDAAYDPAKRRRPSKRIPVCVVIPIADFLTEHFE